MGDSKPHKPGFDIDIIDLSGISLPTKKEVSEKQKEPSEIKAPKQGTEPLKLETNGDSPNKKEPAKPISNRQKGFIIDRIFAKMKKRGNFPTFSQQIASLNKMLKLNYASAKDIAEVIGKDFALSQKLLRLVNSSFYGQFGEKRMTSITQAMIILGADCIQQTAASLMLFEMMQASSQTAELKDMTIGNFVSGIIAKDMAQTKGMGDTETFLICSMFHNIGEYMIIFYFPELLEEINNLMIHEHMDKDQAAISVLGITYQELGIGIAKKWNLPDYILKSMKPMPKKKPEKKKTEKEITNDDLLRCVSSFSNEICQVAMQPDELTNAKSLGDVVSDFQEIVDISSEEIEDVLSSACEKIQEHASSLKINLDKSKLLQKISSENIKKEISKKTPTPAKKVKKVQKEITIQEKIKKIKEILKTDYNIGDVLTEILEIMYSGFNYKRVVMGIKMVDTNQILVRYALGDKSENFKKNFRYTLQKSKDVFNASVIDESDTIVHDINSQMNTSTVPKWYKQLHCAKGFSLYPIIVDNIPFGIFYVDSDSTKLDDYMKHHSDMKKLRTLAVKAIKIKSG